MMILHRRQKPLLLLVALLFLVYLCVTLLGLSVVKEYTWASRDGGIGQSPPGQNNIFSSSSKLKLPLSLKNIIAGKDGNFDVVFNLDMKELLKGIDGLQVGNPNGEMTDNALPAHFNIIKFQKDTCDSESLQYLIYVHSAPKNKQRRKLVRSTWGDTHLFKDQRTRVIFLMGTSEDKADQKIIDDEFQIHGDIVQGDFIEHYQVSKS